MKKDQKQKNITRMELDATFHTMVQKAANAQKEALQLLPEPERTHSLRRHDMLMSYIDWLHKQVAPTHGDVQG